MTPGAIVETVAAELFLHCVHVQSESGAFDMSGMAADWEGDELTDEERDEFRNMARVAIEATLKASQA